MNPDRHRREGELFAAACDLAIEAQEELLLRECGDDDALLARVRTLLAHDSRGERSLGLPSLTAVSASLLGDELPERLGSYRILRVLGRGGMGIVYEAEQSHPRRSVAIKVLRSAAASAHSLRRFEHEARILGRMSHPGIAQVHEAGVAETVLGPRPYLVMELVRGEPLSLHARAGDLDRDARIELLARICDAVQHAHDKGVIHRDLKPGNILVDESGAPKIVDFGIARVLDEGPGDTTFRTRTGELLGTIAYMSPEQVSGPSAGVDARSDVYSLGVIAYELLSGRLPYELSDKPLHVAVRTIAEESPPRLGFLARDLRGDIETIVGKAIEKERDRRYASAGELGLDLRRVLRHEPILARPTSGLYQLRRFARRNRKLTAAFAVAVAALILGTAAALVSARAARESERAALEQKGEAVAARTSADQSALRANLAAAALADEAKDPIAALQALDAIPESARGWEWRRMLAHIDDSALALEDDAPLRDATPSADGAQIVAVSAAGMLRRWDARSGELLASLDLGAPLSGPAALGAGGGWLAGVIGPERSHVVVWDTATGRRRAETTAAKRVDALAISASGDLVALGGANPSLWRPDSPEPRAPIRLRSASALAFDESASRLAIAYGGPAERSAGWGWFCVVDTDTAAIERKGRRFSDQPLTGIAIGATGRPVVLASVDRRAYVADREAGESTQTFAGHRAGVRCVAIDRAGLRAASGSSDRTVRIWDLASGAQTAVLSGAPGRLERVAFLPDGSGVVGIAGKSARVWRLGDREALESLAGHTSYVYGVAFLEDGRRVLSGAWDGTFRIWDARTRECLGLRKTGSPRVFAVAAGPAGTWFATAEPGRIGLWSADTAEPIGELRPADARGSAALSASRDGELLAARSASGVTLWRVRERAVEREFPRTAGSPTSAVALSPDAAWLASDAPGRSIVVWERATGAELVRLRGHKGQVEALAFAPDGGTLASGAVDGSVRLWDTRSWTARAVLSGHTDRVYSLAFSPDGARLASGSNDTSIRIWSVAGGAGLGLLNGHLDYVYELAFSPDGGTLASASGDTSVRLWDTRPAREIWPTRERVQRLRRELRAGAEELTGAQPSAEATVAALRADASLDAERREAALQLVLQRNLEPPPGP